MSAIDVRDSTVGKVCNPLVVISKLFSWQRAFAFLAIACARRPPKKVTASF